MSILKAIRSWFSPQATKPEPGSEPPAAVPVPVPVSSTCESEIELSDPRASYSLAYTAGQLWAIANESTSKESWPRFCKFRAKHRLCPDEHTIRKMSAALSGLEDIDDNGAKDYLSGWSLGIPSNSACVTMYVDGWFWGACQIREEQREQRRLQAEARRADDLKSFRRFSTN